MYWVFAGVILLIFPFLFGVTVYYNEKVGKVFINVNLFGFIGILSGYFTYKKGIIYLHITNKRALAMKILPTTTMIRGNSQFYKSIEVMSLRLSVNVPLKANYVTFANSINVINSILLPLYKNQKPFIDITNKITIGKLDYVEGYLQAKILINLVVLITIIVRKLISGVENE